MTWRLGRPQSLSGRLWEEKALLLLPVFKPRTVQSVATHNTDCTPHLKYLSTAQYRDGWSLWSTVGYSLSVALSVALSVGIAQFHVPCYSATRFFIFKVTPHPFSIIIPVSSPYIQKCVLVHTHRAHSVRKEWGSQDTAELWILSEELVACHPTGTQNLEVAHKFSETLWPS